MIPYIEKIAGASLFLLYQSYPFMPGGQQLSLSGPEG